MEHYVLEYIKQRMRHLGFEDYSFQTVRVQSPVFSILINAQNEYYYLAAKTVHESTVITSDMNIWIESENYEDFNFHTVQEFTGSIQITCDIPIDIEFIRVVPHVKREEQICLYLKEVQTQSVYDLFKNTKDTHIR